MSKNKINWPEAIRDAIGWISFAFIVFSIGKCSVDAEKAKHPNDCGNGIVHIK